MSRIITYLTFNGNCAEAMRFYQQCLGGELSLQTLADSPQAGGLPSVMQACVVHASLQKDHLLLMGSDMMDERLSRGNSVSILLECQNLEEMEAYYYGLAKSGQAIRPIEQTFWGATFGGLIDRYGNQWLFLCKY